ncbi:MAG: response regulator transcription factor [Armatimonadetes bacterium]|nr:response regulator transcription factor [Armatimonadota bacterium]
MRILLVEDDPSVAHFVQKGLREEGYAVDVVADGEAGELIYRANPYDLLIVDVMLPGQDGFTLVQHVRQQDLHTPLLLLTARAGVDDRVEGLSLGADDYLTKPFAFSELVARVRALLRRASLDQSCVLTCADLVLDPVAHTVSRAGQPIDLTRTEYALLEYLLRRRGEVVTRAQITEQVWGMSFDPGTNRVSVYISYLRDHLDRRFSPALIHTVRGVGYTLAERPPAGACHG